MLHNEQRWYVGQPPKIPIPGLEGVHLRVGSQVHHTVAFLGFADPAAPGGIKCEGTGFFLFYKGMGYLITVRHVARILEGSPFVLRVNRLNDAGAVLLGVDTAKWLYHPNSKVDLAALAIKLTSGTGINAQHVREEDLLTPERLSNDAIDVGDMCYTVGLFRFIFGKQKNFPLVHSGNIALMPPTGETIPVWNAETKSVEQVEGYLIESRALHGASGSPVFARMTIRADLGLVDPDDPSKPSVPAMGDSKIKLLGVYQGAWFLPPDATLADGIRVPRDVNVPVGIGVVIPAGKIVELLETDELRKSREKALSNAAQMTGISEAVLPSNDENPTHREDFKSLLVKAAKTPPQDD